ncbi:MAG: metalloregulator ArsR/SmtB family transcription factor [Gammaproteobacteria bacterium]|jgi:ArsR family transcriptional regulator|nr:metalloregulator ArsR/SmtB family transcription factor [Gammaproteobacteria bacterium]
MHIEADTLFRMLADTTRLRALMLLQEKGELCVCELTHALDLSQPKISRHLAQLRETELLLTHRRGQWMYYRINPNLPEWAQTILQHTLTGNANAEPFRSDHRVLKDMPNRPGAACCA